jgi:hypothetical protein
MSTPRLPGSSGPPLKVLQWFVLLIALGPLACCGGCLGLAWISAIWPRAAPTEPSAPTERAPTSPTPR